MAANPRYRRSDRDLGRLGQEELRRWMAQTGIITNSSRDHDATGWDFFLEWPHRFGTGDRVQFELPLDRRPGPIQCLLQVKTTDGVRRRADIKLTNWLRFVRSPLPCFFLVLEYDGRDECQRAYLVHVGDETIHDVLKRLRELSAERSVHLHKRYRALTWSRSAALSTLGGHELKRRVESFVGNDILAYQKRKLAVLNNAGYQSGSKRIDARVRPPEDWKGDPRDLILDFKLGLVPYLIADNARVIDNRFGIPASEPEETFEGGRIESEGVEPFGTAKVRIGMPGTNRNLRLGMSARAATHLDVGEERRRAKFRLTAPFIDLVWRVDNPELTLTLTLPSPTESQPLRDLQKVAELIDMIRSASELGQELDVEMRSANLDLGRGSIATRTRLVEPHFEWASLVLMAARSAAYLEILGDLETTVSALVPYNNALKVLFAILRPSQARLRVEVSISSPMKTPELEWCIPLATRVRIADHTMQVAAALIGHPQLLPTNESSEQRYRLDGHDLRIHAQQVFVDPEQIDKTTEQLIADVCESYASTHSVVRLEIGTSLRMRTANALRST